MQYQRIYAALVARAQARPRPTGYTESHHIVPRFAGGTDDPNNLVYLTYKEHFLAHLLLTKLYPGNDKAIRAAWAVYVGHELPFGIRKTRRVERLERAWSFTIAAAGRKRVGVKSPMYGKTHTLETKAKMSAATHLQWKAPESRAKIIAANIGKTLSPETKAKLSAAQKLYWEARRAAA